MNKFIRWLFWNIVYKFWRQPTELVVYIDKGTRCRWPWKKFKPSVYHCDDGREWQIYLTAEQSYTEPRQTLIVDVHISCKTGCIVGFDVWDEDLLCENRRKGDNHESDRDTNCTRHSCEDDSRTTGTYGNR